MSARNELSLRIGRSGYIDPRVFAAPAIELRYIVHDCPPYRQGNTGFEPSLSIVDALAWLGPVETAQFIAHHGRSGREVTAC